MWFGTNTCAVSSPVKNQGPSGCNLLSMGTVKPIPATQPQTTPGLAQSPCVLLLPYTVIILHSCLPGLVFAFSLCTLSSVPVCARTARLPSLCRSFGTGTGATSPEPTRPEFLFKHCLHLHLPHCTSPKWVLYQFPGCSATNWWSGNLSLDLSQEPL